MTTPAGPPTVRATFSTYRALFDRSRSTAMFEKFAQHGDLVEIRGPLFRLWLCSDPALARELLVDHGRSVTKGFGVRMISIGLCDCGCVGVRRVRQATPARHL